MTATDISECMDALVGSDLARHISPRTLAAHDQFDAADASMQSLVKQGAEGLAVGEANRGVAICFLVTSLASGPEPVKTCGHLRKMPRLMALTTQRSLDMATRRESCPKCIGTAYKPIVAQGACDWCRQPTDEFFELAIPALPGLLAIGHACKACHNLVVPTDEQP